jgi:hypothetical protein
VVLEGGGGNSDRARLDAGEGDRDLGDGRARALGQHRRGVLARVPQHKVRPPLVEAAAHRRQHRPGRQPPEEFSVAELGCDSRGSERELVSDRGDRLWGLTTGPEAQAGSADQVGERRWASHEDLVTLACWRREERQQGIEVARPPERARAKQSHLGGRYGIRRHTIVRCQFEGCVTGPAAGRRALVTSGCER